MDPLKFPQSNGLLAASQPQFRALPIYISEPDERGVSDYIGKYQLTDLELAQINETGCLWFGQSGNCFHPISPSIYSPFAVIQVQYKYNPTSGNYDFWVPNSEMEMVPFLNLSADQGIRDIVNSFENVEFENLYFVERPSMAIAADGSIESI